MRLCVSLRSVVGAALIALAPTLVSAHEFMVMPASVTVESGARFSVAVLSTRIFMLSQKLETAKDVRVALCTDGKREPPIALSPNKIALTLDGRVTAPSSKTFIVCGIRLTQVWSVTPDGDREATKKTPGASNSRKIEQFAKAVINLSAADDGYKAVVGDTLEIVPVTNPAAAKVGDEITFKVLFKGEPLSTPVFATYDRFSENETTYAYYTEGGDDGTAKVQITHSGRWMVRAETQVPEKTEDYDYYVARAVLVFQVK